MSNLDKIEHIVVLMMENRSFDNVLGWLYPDNADYRGVNSSMSNPDSQGTQHFVTQGTDATMPFPDPNEPYNHVYAQMFSESFEMPVPMTAAVPAMQGFVKDYENALQTANEDAEKKHEEPFPTEPGVIMNCFTPESLPVINALAKAYAVCDNWYCSVPTETFPNRSYIHAGTSSGHVFNTWKTGPHFWDVGVFINDTPTVFNLLEEKSVPWRIYHAGPVFATNSLICQEKMYDFVFDGFSSFDNFAADAASGNLPAYTFIEPNFICSSLYGPETDMHPAYGVYDTGAPTDARYGDQFILDVYTNLKNSPCWDKTLFIITFDEHGGCFDHYPVEPSTNAVSPDGVVIEYEIKSNGGTNGGSNFNFERFGVRVPAVLISPWIAEGTICHTQFDHTSVIRTVSEKWLGGQNLLARDKIANCVSEVLSLDAPRTDSPDIPADTPPLFQDCSNQPLSPLQLALVAAAARFVGFKANRLIDLNALDTKEKAVNALEDAWQDFLASRK
jgi:phospholipase C